MHEATLRFMLVQTADVVSYQPLPSINVKKFVFLMFINLKIIHLNIAVEEDRNMPLT